MLGNEQELDGVLFNGLSSKVKIYAICVDLQL